MPTDDFKHHPVSLESPARGAIGIAASDDDDVEPTPRALYIGVAGDLTVIMASESGSQTQLFKNVPVGIFPIRVRRVMATETTAEFIVGLY